MTRLVALIACAAAIALGATIRASSGQVGVSESSALTRLATSDATRGWEGVGRLEFGQSSFCTGALIGERLVLTAAHCLFNGKTGARIPDAEIRFLAGWRDGRAEAYRGVRRAVAHPEYAHGDEASYARVSRDLAVLELDRPVRTGRILPFPTGDGPRRGEEVAVVSYARDRADAPSLQETCHVLRRAWGVAVLSCSVDFGASGAPVFRIGEAGPEIASVVSAKGRSDGDDVALASEFGTAFREVMAAFEEAPPAAMQGGMARVRRTPNAEQMPRMSGGSIVSNGSAGSATALSGGSGGAKFVKP